MNLPYYDFTTNDYQTFEFYSEGPKGRIKKIVRYVKIRNNPKIYNLGFGDENIETKAVHDLIITDNNDRDKVLATVASTIKDFCDHNGNHYIYIEGSTTARTRLYQINISRFLDQIMDDFYVYGLIGDVTYNYQKNINYEAFLVKRK